MFENIMNFFKKMMKKEQQTSNSKDTAKERLHLVLMQDRANVSADFLDLMKQEIIDVIKKYIEVDESAIDVRLTNKENEDGTNGAPALYANIPIINIKDETRKQSKVNTIKKFEENKENEIKEETKIQETQNKNESIESNQQESKSQINVENKTQENIMQEEIKQEEQNAHNDNDKEKQENSNIQITNSEEKATSEISESKLEDKSEIDKN